MPTIFQLNKTLLGKGGFGYVPPSPPSGFGLQIIGSDGSTILDTKYAPQALVGVLYFLGESSVVNNNLVTPADNAWHAFTGTTVSFSLSRTALVMVIGQMTDDQGNQIFDRTAAVAGQLVQGYNSSFQNAGEWWSSSFISQYNLVAGSYTASIYYSSESSISNNLNVRSAFCTVYRWGA